MKNSYDIIIVGGGIIGLFQAIEAKRRGLSVALIENRELGFGASGAGSGILMTHGATQFHSKFREFYVRSINEYYPEWFEMLSQDNHQEIRPRQTGSWQFYTEESKLVSLQSQLTREASQNFEHISRIPEHLKDWMVPKDFVGGFHFPLEKIIHNNDLLAAMTIWARNHHIDIFENTTVKQAVYGSEYWSVDIQIQAQSVVSSSVKPSLIQAKHLICSSGAWLDETLKPLGYESRMTPVRGQLAWYEDPDLLYPPLNTSLHIDGHFYAIPREDGFILGATTEAREWDQRFVQSGDEFLNENIQRYFPKSRHTIKHKRSWAGLRPRTRDRQPLMGCIDPSINLWVNAGHYKNGLSMAPLAARVMIQTLLGEVPDVLFEEFHPLRKKGLVSL